MDEKREQLENLIDYIKTKIEESAKVYIQENKERLKTATKEEQIFIYKTFQNITKVEKRNKAKLKQIKEFLMNYIY